MHAGKGVLAFPGFTAAEIASFITVGANIRWISSFFGKEVFWTGFCAEGREFCFPIAAVRNAMPLAVTPKWVESTFLRRASQILVEF